MLPLAHPDPRVDRLCDAVLYAVQEGQRREASRAAVFTDVWGLTMDALGEGVVDEAERALALAARPVQKPVPHLSEPWYC